MTIQQSILIIPLITGIVYDHLSHAQIFNNSDGKLENVAERERHLSQLLVSAGIYWKAVQYADIRRLVVWRRYDAH